MAKRMFGVSISLVSLVDEDRQWFKSKQGLEATETPRKISFCGHAINQYGLSIIPNALEEERFAEVMQHVFRQSDVIGRLGVDEFVVMQTDSDHEQIGNILDRFSEAIEETNKSIDKPYNIEFSAGVANFSHDTEDSLEEMIEQADAAM